jgi:hypothetical protein
MHRVTRTVPTAARDVTWPHGKTFAFTVFDDPDSQTLEVGRRVYDFLEDLGFRTTKAVWPVRGTGTPSDNGGTCAEPEYRTWAQSLHARGFEIGYHNATGHTSERAETYRALEAFAKYFGTYPSAMANHYNCGEAIYGGDARLTGLCRILYNVLTRGKNRRRFAGHVKDHPWFWGDMCRDRIKYVRNFVFADVNTLSACPYMPYRDPRRPYVNAWFAASEGDTCRAFVERLDEARQDRLEREGGACIMYAHFAHGFVENGRLDGRFVALMKRLSRKNGWFVPVTSILDHLAGRRDHNAIDDAQRRSLERRWLWHKVRFGTA